jgi:hypothetical protein
VRITSEPQRKTKLRRSSEVRKMRRPSWVFWAGQSRLCLHCLC